MSGPSAGTLMLAGPMGLLETLYAPPAQGVNVLGVAVLAHPNPRLGGHNRHKVIHTMAKALNQLGYHCYTPNYRGVGLSVGTYDAGPGETSDLLAIIAQAQQRHPGLKLVLAGFSFGGHVALKAAQHTQPSALLLIAPSVTLHESGSPHAPQAQRTTLIAAEADAIDPLAPLCAWARPQNLPLILIPGASHFFDGQLPLLSQAITRYFRH
ncbi:MAG: alpha/beta fold hydrolase [Neisseriaceae bacterium]|nr:alpha/beta fold hydrolase [Neisseriaceae bacterium]